MSDKEKVISAIQDALMHIGAITRKGDELHSDMEFKETFAMDSLDIVDFVMEVEDDLNICIPNEAIEDWKTIGDVTETCLSKM